MSPSCLEGLTRSVGGTYVVEGNAKKKTLECNQLTSYHVSANPKTDLVGRTPQNAPLDYYHYIRSRPSRPKCLNGISRRENKIFFFHTVSEVG